MPARRLCNLMYLIRGVAGAIVDTSDGLGNWVPPISRTRGRSWDQPPCDGSDSAQLGDPNGPCDHSCGQFREYSFEAGSGADLVQGGAAALIEADPQHTVGSRRRRRVRSQPDARG